MHIKVLVYDDVAGLEVHVIDVQLVHLPHDVDDLPEDGQPLLERQLIPRLVQGLALGVLHDVDGVVRAYDITKLHHVGLT